MVSIFRGSLRLLPLGCVLFLLPGLAAAQQATGRLRGQVLIRTSDSGGQVSEKPAQSVHIIAIGSFEKVSGRTGDDGTFLLKLPVGQWKIEVSAPGLEQDGEHVGAIWKDEEYTVAPNPIILKPVAVKPESSAPVRHTQRPAPRRARRSRQR